MCLLFLSSQVHSQVHSVCVQLLRMQVSTSHLQYLCWILVQDEFLVYPLKITFSQLDFSLFSNVWTSLFTVQLKKLNSRKKGTFLIRGGLKCLLVSLKMKNTQVLVIEGVFSCRQTASLCDLWAAFHSIRRAASCSTAGRDEQPITSSSALKSINHLITKAFLPLKESSLPL